MADRKDPNPDPYAVLPLPLPRQPGRAQPKQIAVDSTRPVERMRAHVTRTTTTQSIADDGTFQKITWNTAASPGFDPVGLLTASNELKVPDVGKVTAGWLVHAHVTWSAAAAGFREMQIRAGSTDISRYHLLGSNDDMSQDAAILVNDPAPGTLYSVHVRQTSGSPLNLKTEPENSYFEIVHLW